MFKLPFNGDDEGKIDETSGFVETSDIISSRKWSSLTSIISGKCIIQMGTELGGISDDLNKGRMVRQMIGECRLVQVNCWRKERWTRKDRRKNELGVSC